MSEVTSHQVVRALRAAKARIQKYGWGQEHEVNFGTGDCVVTAFPHFGVSRSLLCMCYEALAAVVNCAPSTYSLVNWNDAAERTREDVLQAFDSAIELARGPR